MKDQKMILCILGDSMRKVVSQANELNIKKEDIIQFFELRGDVYLIYYK